MIDVVWFRDIKPENFLLKSKDDITNVKLIDFGLSKDYSEVKIMQTPSGSVSQLFNKNRSDNLISSNLI